MSDALTVSDAYRAGSARFMGIELLVAPGALVPRAETELLAATCLKVLRDSATHAPRVIDMCCGVGNLACAIALNAGNARVWAADLTDECVGLAQRNAKLCALEDRVSVHQGDLFLAFDGLTLEDTIDVIVCNPPYISDKRLAGDRASLLALEPREAFDAGPYGIAFHLRVIETALRFLRPGGVLLLEVGLGQDRQVTRLLQRKAYEAVSVVPNEAGEGRVVTGRRAPTARSSGT